MTTTHAALSVADLTKPGGALDLGRDPARLLIHMIRLLATSGPMTRYTAENALTGRGIDPGTVQLIIDAWTERNDAGDIVGLGVTYNRTPHQMTVGDRRMWAWCAMDLLIFTVVLDRPVTAESAAPRSGGTVRLDIAPDGIRSADPADAVVTWPARTSDQVDISTTTAIWGSFCHHSFLFPSRIQAEQWATGRDIEILSLDQGFEIARTLASGFLRYET